MLARRITITALTLLLFAPTLHATVFINEVLINPPSSSDDFSEFIELLGTPGMKLDGYGIAVINGAQRKVHPDNPIPPDCSDDPTISQCLPEIDEFFSLDGLSLGANGVFFVGIGQASNYPTMLADTNARLNWGGATPVWNGFLDVPGKMSNDGSSTVMLVRNRPGATQANCPTGPCNNVRWGKDVQCDVEITATDPPVAGMIQYGNGNLDDGAANPPYPNTLDIKGKSTLADITDDLEIVDEVSFSDGGWEYDEDHRLSNVGSPSTALAERHVHSIGNPGGFNPDCISRVDYRTSGNGWAPVAGAVGQLGNGNNWQDTATEQWIRGESKTTSGSGSSPPYFYNIAANPDPDSVQPYLTNVPTWLADGQGADFNFTTANTYQIKAGQINPLAVAFIPGDVNRDGVCDASDIAKLAAVMGEDNWIFSNGFNEAPYGNSGDPATQTRPWDVDGTGNNGIEPSDMQWTLNFQGDTTGRVVGVRYDSTTPTPLGSGVVLNPNTGVICTVTATATNGCGRALNALLIGDTVDLIVHAQVTSGANTTAGQQNGVMQFVQDLSISSGGVIKVMSVQSLGSFSTTRSTIQALQGTNGDLGVKSINGYATSFTQGVSSAADLYHVSLKTIAAGNVNLTVGGASLAKFAASTPGGLKIGHTNGNGNPLSVTQAAPIAIGVINSPVGDVNIDGLFNTSDINAFANVLIGVDSDPQHKQRSDVNCDGVADGRDVSPFISLFFP